MRNAKLWAFIGAIIVLFVLNMVFGWSDALSGTAVMATMRALLEENALVAGLVYVLVSTVACVVLMSRGSCLPWWRAPCSVPCGERFCAGWP